MEPIIGSIKFSLEFLVKAAVLDTQEINSFLIILWVGK